jgi:hypothetical protein
MSTAQQKALASHRRRRRDSGIVRVEVQVPASDAEMVRGLAAVLRGAPDAARAARDQLRGVAAGPAGASVFDIFGADLPDAYFEGVFEPAARRDPPRDVDL